MTESILSLMFAWQKALHEGPVHAIKRAFQCFTNTVCTVLRSLEAVISWSLASAGSFVWVYRFILGLLVLHQVLVCFLPLHLATIVRMITILSVRSSSCSNLSLLSTQSSASIPGPYFRHSVLILNPQWAIWFPDSLFSSNNSQHYTSVKCPNMLQGVLPCVDCSSNIGGRIGTHATSQRACHWCRWPWRVLSAPSTPGGQGEVQNHQRQEGHGQGHVSHILPTPGEGGRQKGELNGRNIHREEITRGRWGDWRIGRRVGLQEELQFSEMRQ